MLVKLMGVHKVKAKLANGDPATYYYAWRGGPRIKAKPDTDAFVIEFARLTRSRPESAGKGTVGELIQAYVASEAYKGRKDSTRKGYDWAIDRIEAEYLDLPLSIVNGKGFRKDVLRWRDENFAETPRAADLIVAVFGMILAFGVDREDIDRNPLEKVSKLADSSRREMIWTDEQVAKFKATAPARMVLAMELARWTGQRQGDLLRLTWTAYDGQYISLRQGKTGANVRVRVVAELKALLDAQKRTAVTILTNREGRPYASGFGSSWGKAMRAAEVTGVTFHDLRGTFITLASRDGASIKEIAEVSGHTEKDAERIIKKHYLKTDGAITKLELGNKTRRKL
ncbi:MAG: Integrase [Verrucomicrobiales bacterium]|nr:Integrase [Verrucomicrobiales bacterium]